MSAKGVHGGSSNKKRCRSKAGLRSRSALELESACQQHFRGIYDSHLVGMPSCEHSDSAPTFSRRPKPPSRAAFDQSEPQESSPRTRSGGLGRPTAKTAKRGPREAASEARALPQGSPPRDVRGAELGTAGAARAMRTAAAARGRPRAEPTASLAAEHPYGGPRPWRI
jgi:hypothetical protein